VLQALCAEMGNSRTARDIENSVYKVDFLAKPFSDCISIDCKSITNKIDRAIWGRMCIKLIEEGIN
jgi:hypothetical protein